MLLLSPWFVPSLTADAEAVVAVSVINANAKKELLFSLRTASAFGWLDCDIPTAVGGQISSAPIGPVLADRCSGEVPAYRSRRLLFVDVKDIPSVMRVGRHFGSETARRPKCV